MTSLKAGLGLSGGGVVSLVGAGGKTTLLFRLARELSRSGETVITTTTTKILVPAPAESPRVILAGSLDALRLEAAPLLARHHHVTAAPGRTGSEGEKLSGYRPETVDAIRDLGIARWVLVEADGAARRPLKAPEAHEPVIPPCSGWVIAVAGLDGLGAPLEERFVFRSERFSRVSGLPIGAPVDARAVAYAAVHREGLFKGAPSGAARILFLNKADTPERLNAAREIADRLAGARPAAPAPTSLPPIRIVIGQALSDPPIIEFRDGEWSCAPIS